MFLLAYDICNTGCHCDVSISTYIILQFDSFPPLFSLFPHSHSQNDFDSFQCSIFIHVQKVPQLYSPPSILFTFPPSRIFPSLYHGLFYIPVLHCFSVYSLFFGDFCLSILLVNILYLINLPWFFPPSCMEPYWYLRATGLQKHIHTTSRVFHILNYWDPSHLYHSMPSLSSLPFM
jgi:hypothetical protein